MNRVLNAMGAGLARYLSHPVHQHSVPESSSPAQLRASLQRGDVLLVEGNSRISVAIKYLTQSTWSHAALYIGEQAGYSLPAQHCFVEADLVDGVRTVGFDEFSGLNTRICRPQGLLAVESQQLVDYALSQRGKLYDLRNVLDLVRYLLATPPVPVRYRRRMLALGSGDPTRAICSTLIAQAFQSIQYPILPEIERQSLDSAQCPGCELALYHARDHRLFVPRDFDISPYFQIVKPTLDGGFDYHQLRWAAHDTSNTMMPVADTEQGGLTVVSETTESVRQE